MHYAAAVLVQVVQSLGFDVKQEFPIYADRMPTQLLAYLRLSRVQDSAEIAKVCSHSMALVCVSFTPASRAAVSCERGA